MPVNFAHRTVRRFLTLAKLLITAAICMVFFPVALRLLASGSLGRTFVSNETFSTSAKRLMAAQNQTFPPGTFSVAFITVPNEEVAKTLSRLLVTEKLAACVNILPNVKSIYEWKGKIEEENELLLVVKTKSNKIDDLSIFVRANHPYEVAEVISLPIENGNPPYLRWLNTNIASD